MFDFFRNLSVRWKLFGGFGAVLTLSVIAGSVLIIELGRVNSGSDVLATNSLPSVMTIDEIAIHSANVDGVLSALPTLTPAVQRQAGQLIVADEASIKKEFSHYSAQLVGGGGDAAGLKASQADWNAFLGSLSGYSAALKAGGQTLGRALVKAYTPFTKLQTDLTKWRTANIVQANAQAKSNHSAYNFALALGIALLALVVLIGAGIAFGVSRSISRRIQVVLERLRSLQDHCVTYLRQGVTAMADGDLTHRYSPVTEPIENPSNDEIGSLARAVNTIRDLCVVTIEAYNSTAASLSDTIGHVVQTAGSVQSSSQQMALTSAEAGRATDEIAQAVGDVASGAERQVRMIDEARRAAEEVTHAVTESAENARQTADVAQKARAIADSGIHAAEQANDAMRAVRESSQQVSGAIGQLAQKSERIGAIVQTITGIAEQTNLLALNAAIEAARAGEHGRGFAVVAEEVRKLAEESEHAAQEISGLIAAIQTETGHAVDVVEDGARRTADGAAVVEQTREAFEQIGVSVSDVTARVEQIAAAVQQVAANAQTMQDNMSEVAAVAEQSSASTEEVSASTEQTSASTQQIAASAQQLSASAESLNDLIAQFRTEAEPALA